MYDTSVLPLICLLQYIWLSNMNDWDLEKYAVNIYA